MLSILFYKPNRMGESSVVGIKKLIGFLVVALMNLILPPYGGPLLALRSSVYLGYDAAAGPTSLLVGTIYLLIAGALFGWLYNGFADGF